MRGCWLRVASGAGWPAAVIAAAALATSGAAGAGVAGASVTGPAAAAWGAPIAARGSQEPGNKFPLAPPPPGYGTGPGYCTGYPGGVTSSYNFDDVYACQGTTTGATTFDNPGTGVYAWQCVELSARFLWAIDGIWAGPGSGVHDGADLVSVVHASHPGIGVGTAGPGSVPVAGDVISLGPGGGSDPVNGHTAVVISANPGMGQFEIMSENAPEGRAGEQSLQVDLSGGHNGKVLFSGSWTQASWLELGTGQPVPVVRAVNTPDGHIQLFWDSNGVIKQNWYSPSNGTFGNWVSPGAMQNGAQAAGNPAIVKRSGQQVIDVFTRSTDGQIRETWYNWGNGHWGGWIPIAGSAFTGDPQTVATSDGHEQIFADDNGAIKQNWFAPSNGATGNWVTI